jgi:hypothetical protein
MSYVVGNAIGYERTIYSRHPLNPYPSVEAPGYGLGGVMGYKDVIWVKFSFWWTPECMGY